ncbi:MAG: ZIP family metal transporter [Candidatus Kerfeldbacteria bacterium]|nr:ZIP family metal transporter [Candidatus Kerfeldbacteria bacterium]
MIQVIAFALVNGFSLLLGAAFGVYGRLEQRIIAAFMAFGAGVLICALTFGLMDEAFLSGGFDAVIIGFLAGGLIYIGSDYLVHYLGGRKHKRHQFKITTREPSGFMITLGSMLDGVPESIALGITLFAQPNIGLMMLAAIAISNFPEGIASASGLKKAGFRQGKIFTTWIAAGLFITLITIFSYLFLHNLNPNTIGILESLAAGAILAMLAANMMPEAYEEGGFAISTLTVLGFLMAFVVLRL